MQKVIMIMVLLFCAKFLHAQCEIESRLRADGTLYYYAPLTLLYQSNSLELHGSLVTDKENYYLRLSPSPFKEAENKKVLKKDLQVKLANDTSYSLKYFDSWFSKRDSLYTILYLFDKRSLNSFLNNTIQTFTWNMSGNERTFIFQLHPAIIKEQFACFKTPATKL